MQTDSVSIVIATHNMGHLIGETIESCQKQGHKNIEIIVYDDHSTDNTEEVVKKYDVRYIRGEENVGVGEAFNRGVSAATGDIVMLMCADDVFTDNRYIFDVVNEFKKDPCVGYVTRFYYQFIHEDKDRRPIRAWRDKDPIILANNPSGLAFRKSAIEGKKFSNKMFIETSSMASQVLADGWDFSILEYDAIAVRVHDSTSTQRGYWLKRRVSSPVMDWYEIGGRDITRDYVSFFQIKCGCGLPQVFEELWNFIRLRPLNLITPAFWFFGILSVILPVWAIRKVVRLYRNCIGPMLTKEVKRHDYYCNSCV